MRTFPARIIWPGALVLGLALAAPASAGAFRTAATAPQSSVPGGMNYQGRLEKDGFPVTGTKTMEFKLYASPTGGTVLWDSGPLSIDVAQGLFSAELDSITVTALSNLNGSQEQKYLEVTVEGVTLSPRDPVRSVPYAKIAETVEGTIDVSTAGLTVTTPVGAALSISSSAGNVGIGTALPLARLHISSGSGETGNIVIVTTGTSVLASIDGNGQLRANAFIGDGSAMQGLVHTAGDTMTGPLTISNSTLTVTGDAFSVGGNRLVVLTGTGRVGLGTSNPGASLTVTGDSSLVGPSTFGGTVTVKGNAFTVGATSTNVYVDSAGVGIGTAAPGQTLDVNGSAQFGSGVSKSTFSSAGALSIRTGQNITVAGGGQLNGLPASPTGGDATAATSKQYVDTQLLSGGGPWTQSGTQVYVTTPGNAVVVQSTLTVQGNALSVAGSELNVSPAGVGVAGPTTFHSSMTVLGAAQFGSSGVSAFAGTGALTMATGAGIDAGSAKITNMTDPAAAQDAATKNYVDGRIAGGGGPWTWDILNGRVYLTTNSNSVGVGVNPPAAGMKMDVEGAAQFGLTGTKSAFSSAGVLTLATPLATGSGGTGNATGQAPTALALAANGSNCAAGSFPLGVDAQGNVESCSTSISGNAATVTTNANLTGDVTSVGNATTLANIPAISGANLTNLNPTHISAGTAGINISGNAATVTTNANLTGNVTSVGNATTLASIPAISGANLTNLDPTHISAGTAGINISGNAATVTTDANLTGNVTSVGNATTLASIPAISGANLTNLTAGNISAGTLTGNFAFNSPLSLASYSTAQLAPGGAAPAPGAAGKIVFNSTILDVCVSTGSASGNWALAGSKGATGCF